MTSTTGISAEALRTLVTALGLSLDDVNELLAGNDKAQAPTIEAFLPVVADSTSPAAAKTYGSYWRRLGEHMGDRRIDEVKTSELERLLTKMETVQRRNARGGYQARRSDQPRAL